MDHDAFDRLTTTLSTGSSRRRVLRLSAAALGLGGVGQSVAKKKKKKKKKPTSLLFNSFGCVNVGGACRGNSDNCCSGICEGSKPKKGKKDTSRCVAHDQSTCVAGQRQAPCGGVDVECEASNGLPGFCDTTTGNAGYCSISGDCFACKKDKDCQSEFGEGAACIVCAGCEDTGGTGCSQLLFQLP
jgi:hypothetical protein